MVQKSGVHQLRLVVYPIIYKVLYITGGCLGFLPSTVGIISSPRRQDYTWYISGKKRANWVIIYIYIIYICIYIYIYIYICYQAHPLRSNLKNPLIRSFHPEKGVE